MWQPVDAATGREITWPPADWPILIHGASKAGASFFTVALTADLIRRGERMVFMCANGEAIRAWQYELALNKPAVKYSAVGSLAATALVEMQLVTLFKRRGTDLLTSLCALKDWGERIVVIKNVEELLRSELWAVVKSHPRLILSGDFAKTKIDIDPKLFNTQILFSEAPGHWPCQRASLPTYIGEVYQGSRRCQTIVRQVAG